MYLMHMGQKVAQLQMAGEHFIGIRSIVNEKHMPVGISKHQATMMLSLQNWERMRSIPSERQNINRILKALPGGISDAKLKSMRVSLTDTYWFKDERTPLTWEDVNFHKNGLATDFADVAVFEKEIPVIQFNSPDYTTDGVLQKGWITIDSIPTLLKFGELGINAHGKNLLSANEVVAGKIAASMDIDHVNYFPVQVEGTQQMICGSHCFIEDGEHDFVNGLQIANETRSFGRELYHQFSQMGYQQDLDKMIVFDHILHNTDRHEKNFGFIRNATTLEPVRFAPLFDSGSCLGWNYSPNVMDTGEMKPFIQQREKQLELVQKLPCNLLDPNYLKAVVADTYEVFGIPEKQYEIACMDVDKGYQMLAEKEKMWSFGHEDLEERG